MSNVNVKEKVIEIRVRLDPENDKEIYERFRDMINHYKSIEETELLKKIINRAYHWWFKADKTKKIKKIKQNGYGKRVGSDSKFPLKEEFKDWGGGPVPHHGRRPPKR